MANFPDRYLTEYDDSLSRDSYIDPVGTLMIWSAFGRQVFKSRINSISNDVRNYTLNLFHHFLVRKLVNDDEALISRSLRGAYSEKDALSFKHACLIFLENLFVYSMLRHEDIKGADASGILGVANARRLWENAAQAPSFIFTHEREGQILVRQLSLGVSGRYKTPLREIGFFDDAYQYNRPESYQRWSEVESFMAGDARVLLGRLEKRIYPFLKEQLARLKAGQKLNFKNDVPRKLTLAYAQAFASPEVVGGYARGFWLRQTELDQGAAGALLSALESESTERSPKDILQAALQAEVDSDEKLKLERIATLEPLLSDCALMFTLMVGERTHSVASVATQWKKFGRDENRLRDCAEGTMEFGDLPDIRGREASRRLLELQKVANAGSLEDQIRTLFNYHSRVMKMRGQLAWLIVEDDGTIKVRARTAARPDPKDRMPGSWHNSYYLPQFENFVAGLKGSSA